MSTAGTIMTPAPRCVDEDETLVDAARLMSTVNVGALPVCDRSGALLGILTDRDIVVKCLAAGEDPSVTTAGALIGAAAITVDVDEPVHAVLDTMKRHQVRRLLVLEDGQLVGIISQADVVLATAPVIAGRTVAQISA